MDIFGYDQVTIKATSTSEWGNTRLRVALVLDNTGSMSTDGKMDALKTAAQNLLTQLKKAASDPEDVYVSIVPFNKDVNLNAANYAEVLAALGSVGSRERKLRRRIRTQPEQMRKTTAAPGRPTAHSTWNGCITDRDQNFDTTNDATTGRLNALPGGAVFVVP